MMRSYNDNSDLRKYHWYKLTYGDSIWLIQYYGKTNDNLIMHFGDCYLLNTDGLSVLRCYDVDIGKVFGHWGMLDIGDTAKKVGRDDFKCIMGRSNINRVYR
jgi:hypothetical protein